MNSKYFMDKKVKRKRMIGRKKKIDESLKMTIPLETTPRPFCCDCVFRQ